MISFFIKYKKPILIFTIFVFLGSIAYLGLSFYSNRGSGLTAAKVGNKTISNRDLYRLTEQRANALRNQGVEVNEDMIEFLQQQVLASLVSEEILNQAAHKAGLHVSDYEIAYSIQSVPWLRSTDGKFNKMQYENALRSGALTGNRTTPTEFENQLRRDTLANRFRQVLYSFYKLTPQEIKWSYQTQHGNLNNFDTNKVSFASALMDSKMETAQKAFLDDFNANTKIDTFLQ